MTPMTDDDVAVRAALADLTHGQPQFPAGRFGSVKRRAAQHRRRQVVGGLAAVVLAAALVAGLTQLPSVRHAPPQARKVPSWALNWPDHRNGSVPQQILDRAVIAWQYSGVFQQVPDGGNGTVPAAGSSASSVAKLAAIYPVIWYVGQTIDHGQSVVVMFEANGPSGPQLIVGQATASDVMQDQPSWSSASSPWIFSTVGAPGTRRPPLSIGEYVVEMASPAAGGNLDNWLVLLTSPDVQRVTWQVGTSSGVRRTSVETSDGLVVADIRQVTGDVELTGLQTSRGPVTVAHVPVAVSGNGVGQPELAPPPALALPSSFGMVTGGQATGSELDTDLSFVSTQLPYAVFGICYGPAPLRVQINGHAVGSITCDSRTHQLSVPAAFLHGHGHRVALGITTGNLTSWDAELGTNP